MYRIGEEEIAELRKLFETKQLFRYGDPEQGHLQEVANFEKEWAQEMGARYAICVSGGGTSALMCGLVALGIGPGDEVIVPGFTFWASATTVLSVGAIPVIAEIDETLGIDPEDVERKIGPNTRAVIPVHMWGMPANLEAIERIATKHNLKVLEDACQSSGGSYKGRKLGAWGDAGAYSFNFFKPISCGEGGALVTNDRRIYERASIYHDPGTPVRPHAGQLQSRVFIGLQIRASEVMGAILRVQLQRLPGIISDLRRIKRRFIEELSGKPGIHIAPSNDPEGDCGVCIPLQFEDEDQARKFLSSPGVEGGLLKDSGKHYYYHWDFVSSREFGPHPALDPFKLPQNQGLRMEYSKDMCPKTLDILSRTVLVGINPDWTDEEARERIQSLEKAGQAL